MKLFATWVLFCVGVKLITMGCGWPFNISIATGIWLIIYLINLAVDAIMKHRRR